MTEITVATLADLKTVQDLNYTLFVHDSFYDADLEIDWPYSQNGTSYFTKRIQESSVFLAVSDREVVGYIAIAAKQNAYSKARTGELENMFVKEKFRGQGIGSLLITRAKEWWSKNKVEKVTVSAYHPNSRAINFYKKHGFEAFSETLQVSI